MAHRFAHIGLLGLALFATSCGAQQPCSGGERAVSGGRTITSGEELIWESAPPSGPFAPFEGGAKVHFLHHLGKTPFEMTVEVSFNEYPEKGEGSSDAAGDEALKLLQNDEEVVLYNHTCSPLFVRVVVHAPK